MIAFHATFRTIGSISFGPIAPSDIGVRFFVAYLILNVVFQRESGEQKETGRDRDDELIFDANIAYRRTISNSIRGNSRRVNDTTTDKYLPNTYTIKKRFSVKWKVVIPGT